MDQNNQLRGVLPELPPTVSAAEKRILRRGRNFASKRMLKKSSTGTQCVLHMITFKLIVEEELSYSYASHISFFLLEM